MSICPSRETDGQQSLPDTNQILNLSQLPNKRYILSRVVLDWRGSLEKEQLPLPDPHISVTYWTYLITWCNP